MRQRIVQIDAFTTVPFAGNPAAVCLLEEPRSDAWMQSVAREMNLAETAFLTPISTSISANGHIQDNESKKNITETNQTATIQGTIGCMVNDYQLRWFTPAIEVDLCGHATLASAHFLWEEGHLAPEATARFHTRSGLLTATRSASGQIELDFPAEPSIALTPDRIPAELLSGLGVEPHDIGQNRMDLLVEIENEAQLRKLRPHLGLLARLPVRGIIVTAQADPGSPFDFVSRFFAPAAGVDEDPVTGSAHCCLGPYWQNRLQKTEFIAYQASLRGGTVQVKIDGDRVRLSGHAVTTLQGELSEIASQ